jgi:hypothetical protein
MAFATPTDLEDRLRVELSAEEQIRAEKLLDAATVTIKAIAKQTIDAVTGDTVTLDGNGQTILALPQFPVTAVTSVTVDGTLLTVATDYRLDAEQGLLYRAYNGTWGFPAKTWGVKPASIVVVYNHGYATVPADLKGVCVEMAARAWSTPSGAERESIGSYSVSYAKGATAVALLDHERTVVQRYSRPAVA